MTEHRRLAILGTQIDMLTFEASVAAALSHIRENRRGYACHVDARMLLAARDDPDTAAALGGAAFAFADGMPLVWSARMRGFMVERVYGPDFMRAMLAVPGLRHAFFGTSDVLLAALAERLRTAYPAIDIAATLAPPMGEWPAAKNAAFVAALNAAAPDIVWVGLGAPKQELWMARNRAELAAPLLVGVGAAFDFLAGTKPQAPHYVRASGFEWLYRLTSEPGRLWRRYLSTVPRAALLLAVELAVSRLPAMRRKQSR